LAAQLLVGVALLPLLLARSREAAMIACAAAGFAIAGLLITPDVMLGDIVDADHVATGRRQEGTYFGLTNFVNRLPNVLQAVILGEMLTVTGFDASLMAQPEAVLSGMRGIISLAPAAALALALLLTWIYPLHGSRLASMQAEVAELRARTEHMEVPVGMRHAA
jgi:GPH family glycoside/pentoside/hexuronide:cation symporter